MTPEEFLIMAYSMHSLALKIRKNAKDDAKLPFEVLWYRGLIEQKRKLWEASLTMTEQPKGLDEPQPPPEKTK